MLHSFVGGYAWRARASQRRVDGGGDVRDFHGKDMTAGACIELYAAGSWLAPPSGISSVILQKSEEK